MQRSIVVQREVEVPTQLLARVGRRLPTPQYLRLHRQTRRDCAAPLQVTTLAAGADADKYLTIGVDSINYDAPTRVVYVPNPTNGNILQIFDWSGRLVYQCEVIAGISAYPIPAEQMNRGAVYIIKYIEQNEKGSLQMKRKQRFAKFVL